MKDTEESVKWRRGHRGDAFQITEQHVQLHRVQDHSAPMGNTSLRAWLWGACMERAREEPGFSEGQCQTSKRPLNGMPKRLCSEGNREMSQDFKYGGDLTKFCFRKINTLVAK